MAILKSGAAYEVNTDGWYVALGICVVGKSKQQARLSHAWVSDKEELEKVVVSVAQATLALRHNFRDG